LITGSKLAHVITPFSANVFNASILSIPVGAPDSHSFEYGYTSAMIKKCQTLFSKNGIDKILFFINKKFNADKVRIVTSKNKNYFYFISV